MIDVATLRAKLIADTKGFSAGMTAAASQTRKLQGDVQKAGTTVARSARSYQQAGAAVKRMGTDQDRASKSTRDLDRSQRSLGGSLRTAAKAAVAGAAAYVGLSAAKDAITATTTLAKSTFTLKKNFGLTIGTASELGAVLQARGADSRSTGMAFNTLSRQVEAAKSGSEDAAKAFSALGIPMADLEKLKSDRLLFRISDGLEAMGRGTERTAVQSALFGRGWATLAPILRLGSGYLREQLDLANKYGASFSGTAVKSIDELIQTERELKIAQLGLQVQFTKEIAPALIKVGLAIASVVNSFRQAGPGIKGAISSIVADVQRFWQSAGILRSVVKAVWGAIQGTFKAGAQTIKGVVQVISGILTGDFGKAWRGVRTIVVSGVRGVLSVMAGMTAPARAIGGRIANAVVDWGRSWASAGIGAARKLATAVITVIGGLVRAMASLGHDAANAFIGAFKSAISSAASSVSGGGSKIGQAVGQSLLHTIGGLAAGTDNWKGGPAIVGEKGPEMVYLAKGATVLTAKETRQALAAGIPGYAKGKKKKKPLAQPVGISFDAALAAAELTAGTADDIAALNNLIAYWSGVAKHFSKPVKMAGKRGKAMDWDSLTNARQQVKNYIDQLAELTGAAGGSAGSIDSGESASLLRELLNQANLSLAVSQAQYKVFAGMPSFAGGGIVPGSGPVPIMAHGGEIVAPGITVQVNGDIVNTPQGKDPVEVLLGNEPFKRQIANYVLNRAPRRG